MTTENNRVLVDAAPIVPLGIIPDSEAVKPLGVDRLELSVCGGLLVTILLSLLALVAMLLAVPVILLVPEAVPSWANMPVFCSAVVSLVGGLAALARRSYLRYVRVRQV